MLSFNGHSADSDAIHFFKAPDGNISVYPAEQNPSLSTVHHHCTSTDLTRHSINVLLKDDLALHHKSTQFINELSPLFAEDIVPIIPNGSSSIYFGPFKSWIIAQLDELSGTLPKKPTYTHHPVAKVLKIQSLSLSDTNNEVAFNRAGFICNRDQDDLGIAPLFNISQKLWPYGCVSMDWITTSEGFCTLAANILHAYTVDQNTDTDNTPAFPVCSAFADYFIVPMPYNGGHIPIQAIKEWLTIYDEGLDERAWPLRSEHHAPYANLYSNA